jgi:UV DNA damage endonuclease
MFLSRLGQQIYRKASLQPLRAKTRAMAPKRKASALANVAHEAPKTSVPIPIPNGYTYNATDRPSAPKRPRPLGKSSKIATNLNDNSQVINAPGALRASSDHRDVTKALIVDGNASEDSPLSDLPDDVAEELPVPKKRGVKKAAKSTKEGKDVVVITPAKPRPGVEGLGDPEAEGEEEADEEEIKEAMLRSPPVNSNYLPLPWKGRLGYVCSLMISLFVFLLIIVRHVSVHTFATQILPSSARELAV